VEGCEEVDMSEFSRIGGGPRKRIQFSSEKELILKEKKYGSYAFQHAAFRH
jgi:hypothetical protein